MIRPTTLLPVLALGALLACGGGGSGTGAAPAPTKTIADTLTYTNPSSGNYQLVQDTALSTAGHLVLDLIGPSGSLSGVGFYLTADQTKVTWTPVQTTDPYLLRSAPFVSTIMASKLSGNTLQGGVYQKGTTAALQAGSTTILASVALNLNGGVSLANAATIALGAGNAQILNPPGSATATSPIVISVGSLSAH